MPSVIVVFVVFRAAHRLEKTRRKICPARVVDTNAGLMKISTEHLKLKLPTKLTSAERRFQVLASLYKGKLPGDIEDAIHRAQSKKHATINKVPFLDAVSMLLKYPPIKDAFERQVGLRQKYVEWSEVEGRGATSPAVLRWFYEVLVSTAKASSDLNTNVFNRNVGVGVQRHSGPVPFFKQIGILVAGARGPDPGRMSKVSMGTQILNTVPWSKAMENKLRKFVEIANIMGTMGAPKTFEDWIDEVERATKQMPQSQTLGYKWLWLMRSKLICNMRAAQIKGLRLSSVRRILSSTFEKGFPDQKRWLWKVGRFGASRNKAATMGEVFDRLGYSDSPELLTMHLCLIGARAVQQVPADKLKAQRKRLGQKLQSLRKSWKIWPHPATLVREVGK